MHTHADYQASLLSRDTWSCRSIADEELPLLNKRVIVTAPRQYAGKLCGMLVEAGAQALSLPMIQIRRLSQPTAVQVRGGACCSSSLQFTRFRPHPQQYLFIMTRLSNRYICV